MKAKFKSAGRLVHFLVGACVSILAARFLYSTANSLTDSHWTFTFFVVGCVSLGGLNPRSVGLLTFGALSLFSGLGRTGLVAGFDIFSTAISSVWIGSNLRILKDLLSKKSSTPETISPSFSEPLFFLLDLGFLWILLWTGVLAWAERDNADFRSLLQLQPASGYGNSNYFMTACYVWGQGWITLTLFRRGSIQSHCLRHALIQASLILIAFAGLQAIWNSPAGYSAYGVNLAITSPFEDIHSCGAIAVSLFTYFIAKSFTRNSRANPTNWLCLIGLGAVVFACWSRTAWMAAIVCSGLILFSSLPRLGRIVLVVSGALALIAGNIFLNHVTAERNPYLWRLGNLVRIESPTAKDAARVALYRKGLAMIKDSPLTGHGIGKAYVTSPKFDQTPGDPGGKTPEFLHNSILQYSAELGIPAGIGLVVVVVISLLSFLKDPKPTETTAVPWALACYILTQLTANSLNIYPTHQIFFWGLLASLLLTPSKSESSGRIITAKTS